MRDMGLAGVICGKPVSDQAASCPLDRVVRQFHAPAPNVLWVSDFTYVFNPGMRWCGLILSTDGSAFQASQMAWKGVHQRSALRCLAKL